MVDYIYNYKSTEHARAMESVVFDRRVSERYHCCVRVEVCS